VRRLRQTVAPPTRAEVVAGEPIDRFAHVAICTTHCSRALAAVHGEEPPARLLGLLFYQLERLVAQPVRELDHRAGCASASAPGPSQCHRFSSARAGVALSSLGCAPLSRSDLNRKTHKIEPYRYYTVLLITKFCPRRKSASCTHPLLPRAAPPSVAPDAPGVAPRHLAAAPSAGTPSGGRRRSYCTFARYETVEAEASAGSELAEQWLQNFEGGSIMHRPAPTRSFGAIRCGG
jgi:hypothetical protein